MDSASWIESALSSALWQSSAWLIVGLVVSTLVARRPARAHGILLLCMGGAVLTPFLPVIQAVFNALLQQFGHFHHRRRTEVFANRVGSQRQRKPGFIVPPATQIDDQM